MTTITDKKQYPGEQYLNELITNIEFAARVPVEVVRAMAAELQKRREADSAEPVSQTYKLTFEQWLERQHGKIDVDCGCVSTETLLHWMRVAYEAGNSPVTPDGWISCSERMPDTKTAVLVAVEFDRKGDWRMKWATYIPGHPDANDGWIIPGASWKPSHWMPLPEPPQESKSE
ncbi:DUF551 domain-containing protein [Escherichia coli]|nr:DUF551 domain-containing protein [Escherichia coli]